MAGRPGRVWLRLEGELRQRALGSDVCPQVRTCVNHHSSRWPQWPLLLRHMLVTAPSTPLSPSPHNSSRAGVSSCLMVFIRARDPPGLRQGSPWMGGVSRGSADLWRCCPESWVRGLAGGRGPTRALCAGAGGADCGQWLSTEGRLWWLAW